MHKPTDLTRLASTFAEVARPKGVPSIAYRQARDAAIAELGYLASTEAYHEFLVKWCDEYLKTHKKVVQSG